jgi:hypothetical protein
LGDCGTTEPVVASKSKHPIRAAEAKEQGQEDHSMTGPSVSWHRLLFRSLVILAALAGCSRQGQETAGTSNLSVDGSRESSGQNAAGEMRMTRHPKHGFTEYVKNPDLFREEAAEMEEAEATPAPTQQELTELVAAMRSRSLEYEELQKLRKAGNKAVPLLKEALRDERFLFHRYGPSVIDGSAMQTALDLLEPFGLPEVTILEPALRHADSFFRYHALYHLARCGNDDAIAALKAGLKSDIEDCRTYTLMGLAFLKNSLRSSKKFRTELFEATVPLLADKEYGPAEHAPRALLALDLGRAKSVLLGKEVFGPDNRSISKVLQALKEANVSVPGSQLRSLLTGLKDKAKDYPFDYAYAEALVLLARAEGERASDVIQDAQTWGNDHVKEGAAEASVVAAGVSDAHRFVSDLYRRKGASGLTEPQLYYLTLRWLDGEVNNGGFSQYFFNSSGDLALHAVDAARAVGAPELAGILQKANALFGKKGPDPDRDKRMDQLSRIDLEALEKLDDKYYKCPERLSELLPRFVASHAESFKSIK